MGEQLKGLGTRLKGPHHGALFNIYSRVIHREGAILKEQRQRKEIGKTFSCHKEAS